MWVLGTLSKSLRRALLRLPEVFFSRIETVRKRVACAPPYCQILQREKQGFRVVAGTWTFFSFFSPPFRVLWATQPSGFTLSHLKLTLIVIRDQTKWIFVYFCSEKRWVSNWHGGTNEWKRQKVPVSAVLQLFSHPSWISWFLTVFKDSKKCLMFCLAAKTTTLSGKYLGPFNGRKLLLSLRADLPNLLIFQLSFKWSSELCGESRIHESRVYSV